MKSVATTLIPGLSRVSTAEQAAPRVRELARHLEIGHREADLLEALVEYVDKTTRLDHRLANNKDETDKGRAIRSFDEVRRAAFATAVDCYQLHWLRT